MNIVEKFNSNLDLKQLIDLARVAETAELYDDCYQFMSHLTKRKFQEKKTLDVDERNILSVAIKNIIGSIRASLRAMYSFEETKEHDSYTQFIKSQLKSVCEEAIDLITTHILPLIASNADETEVFFNKAIGDQYRYLSEYFDDKSYKENAEKYYEKAMDIAVMHLSETHPTRLGLALNLSVFYIEILKEPEKACALAKRAFDSSIEKLDTLNDSSYKDSTLIMQLLRDNLTSWTGGAADDDDGGGTIGFAVGGAKDVNNFRESINKDVMPSLSAITYNGLLYEYYFDTKTKKHNNTTTDEKTDEKVDDASRLFYPSYCYARVNKLEDMHSDDMDPDPCDYYMTLGLNSNIKQKDFKRKALNLIVILDKSGSMYCAFPGENKSKMRVANEAVVTLLTHLQPEDRFGFLTFDDYVQTIQTLEFVKDIDLDALRKRILRVKEGGQNEFCLAYHEAIKYYDELFKEKGYNQDYENRIVFVTDAQIHIGCSDPNLLKYVKNDAEKREKNRVYTTFIGVGLDFYSTLCEEISSTRGCNYYSVKSTKDFMKQMDDDFDFMVTPLVFNVCLTLKSEGDSCCIDKVYGTSSSNEEKMIKNGEITKIHTLFPSKQSAAKGGTKGGIQLIKLRNNDYKTNNGTFNVEIVVTFEDRNGTLYRNRQCVAFKTDDDKTKSNDMIEERNYYDNTGIRKGILLCKYAELLMNWIKHDINNTGNALQISDKYKQLINQFMLHFEKEMKQCNDNELQKELDILNKLVNLQ